MTKAKFQKAVVLGIVWLAICTSESRTAAACGQAFNTGQSVAAPVCNLPVAASGEMVVAIEVYRGFSKSSFQLGKSAIGYPKSIESSVVDVAVTSGAVPIYLVLAANSSVVWRFTGDVDRISKVIALGSYNFGSEHVALVGLPSSKVRFVEPKTKLLLSFGGPRCGAYSACHPLSYLYWLNDPKRPGMAAVKPVGLWDVLNDNQQQLTAVPAGMINTVDLKQAKYVKAGTASSITVPDLIV